MYRPDPEMDDRTRLMLIEAYGGTNLGDALEMRRRLSVLCVLALFNAVLLSLLVIF